MHFSRPHTSTAVMNIWWLWLLVLDLYTKEPVKSQSRIGEKLIETYQLLLNLGLMRNSRRGWVIIFRCLPTGEHTSLHWAVSCPWSHRWPELNSLSYETNHEDTNMGKIAVGRKWSWLGAIEGEGNLNALHKCIKLSSYTISWWKTSSLVQLKCSFFYRICITYIQYWYCRNNMWY